MPGRRHSPRATASTRTSATPTPMTPLCPRTGPCSSISIRRRHNLLTSRRALPSRYGPVTATRLRSGPTDPCSAASSVVSLLSSVPRGRRPRFPSPKIPSTSAPPRTLASRPSREIPSTGALWSGMMQPARRNGALPAATRKDGSATASSSPMRTSPGRSRSSRPRPVKCSCRSRARIQTSARTHGSQVDSTSRPALRPSHG